MRSWRAFGFGPGQTLVFGGTLLGHVGLGFVPLFGGPGYEAALALGVLLPLPLASLSAACAARAEPARPPLGLLSDAVRFAVWVLLAHLLVLSLHGARVGFCDPWPGLASLSGPPRGRSWRRHGARSRASRYRTRASSARVAVSHSRSRWGQRARCAASC
jgi:hypothetical protein